jgi:ATP-dependent 26S proteasome regulatory subunit
LNDLPLLLLLLQVMSVVGILQDETDPMVSVMKVRAQPGAQCLTCAAAESIVRSACSGT